MKIPDFPECQLPPPSVSDEPEPKLTGNRTNALLSRGSRMDDDHSYAPELTSTASVTREDLDEEGTCPFETRMLDLEAVEADTRTDSSRNLTTLVAWEKIEGYQVQQSQSSLTRQMPQTTMDFSKLGIENDEITTGRVPRLRINKESVVNNQKVITGDATKSVSFPEIDKEDEYVMVETEGKSEKIPLRARFLWKLRRLRTGKKDKTPRCRDHM